MRYSLNGKIVWLTGAGSGIGAALARALAERGATVYAGARSVEALERLSAEAPGRVIPLPGDVADREQMARCACAIDEKAGRLDVAVLNAGTCEYVDVRHFDSAMIERVMRVNFLGLVYCVEAALPLLRKSDCPYLVGMSSSVAYGGLPRAEAYGTSKAAIRHFLQSLRADLTPEGIDVSIICPGFVKTPLTDRNDFDMPMLITAEQAARSIVSGMERHAHEIAFPFVFCWSLRALAALPSRWRNRLLQRIVRKQ